MNALTTSEADRAVAEDAARERDDWSPGVLLWRTGLHPNANDYANANADSDADANANADDDYADATATAYVNDYADAYVNDDDDYADAYANANADANAYAEANDYSILISAFSGGEHVRNGMFLWAQPSGGVVVLRIGWIRRVAGDEYEAHHMVTPKRGGDSRTMFADVAIDGPPKKWTFTRPIPGACPLNRFQILGPVPLKPAQWAAVCPRPDGWTE